MNEHSQRIGESRQTSAGLMKRRMLLRLGTGVSAAAGVGGLLTLAAGPAEAAGSSTYVLKADQDISVKDYGAKADGVSDDGPAFNAALSAAQKEGRGVYVPAGIYRIRTMIDVGGANVRLHGAGIGISRLIVFGEETVMNRVFGHTSPIDGLSLSDLSFVGTVVDDVTGPRRFRSYTSNGFNSALQVSGDLAPDVTVLVRNIRIERVEVKGAAGLPMLFSGVRGETRLEASRSELTMDWGWTWCERVICIGNTSVKSADNGFSISRGTQSAVVQGNMVQACAYHGIWMAGFPVSGAPTDAGPSNFAIGDNTIVNAGKGGIHLDDAPKNGAVVNNTVNGVARGPADQPSDLCSVGVYIGGFPSTNRQSPTDFAQNVTVSANTLVDCARGGVLVTGAKNIEVHDNLIVRPGTPYTSDGTTAIAPTDLDNNFGVSVLPGAQGTVSNLSIIGNVVIDDRSTACTNYAWYTSGSTKAHVSNNREVGSRQAANLIHDNRTGVVHSGVHTYQSNIKFVGGATAGANAATGNVAGFDINGAAGSVRAHQFLTASLKRWLVRTSADTESGGNTGSNFQIDAYDDSGNFSKTMIALTRDGKLSFNGLPPVAQAQLPPAATDTTSAQILVNSLRTTLISLGLGK